MSNPVDDYLGTEKVAVNWGGVADTVIGGAASGAAGAATLALGGAAMKAFGAIMKRSDFKSMMEHNPDLHEFQQENPKQFNQHYNSFRGMNPTFAKDPVVAGSYMRSMSMNPATAGKAIVESMESAGKTRGGVKMKMPGLEYQF